MTLSGPDALRSLEDALRDVRREEDEIAKRLARSGDLIARIRQQESELLRQLAAIRLDVASQAQLTGPLSGAELKARDMLKSHGTALGEAERQLKSLDDAISKLAGERSALQAESAKWDGELKAIGDTVRPALEKRKDHAEAIANAKSLGDVADESMRKTLQAEADREQKGRPYRDDPLFMYLWERGYGTKNYRDNNLVVWLDGMVAGLVGYTEARPNFAMLNEIPLRLREHADRQQAAATSAVAAVAALEAAAIDAAGGKAARAALIAAQAKVGDVDKQIVALQDQRDDLTKTQRELAQGSDPAFAAAISALAEALGREDLQNLLSDARQTLTGQDDTIVQQVDDARQRASDEEADTQEQKARLKTLAGRRRELEDIQYEFKKSGFDNPASTFREDGLIGDVLNEFLRGGITAANYWDQWQRSQSWTRDRGRDDWNFGERFGNGGSGGNWGNINWPDNAFSGGSRRSSPGLGGGFSRPRSGSSGNRSGGGGFKTGGGF
jgi:hypothetical protein